MNLPTVQIKAPYYVASLVGSTETVTRYENVIDVDFEYAAFLHDMGELDVDSYIENLWHELRKTDWYNQIKDNLMCMFTEDQSDELIVSALRSKLLTASRANKKTWSDFI